jgi:hypothetical protein
MKSATLPVVRVEPELRDELEAVLGKTQTISAFVEEAVRGPVYGFAEDGRRLLIPAQFSGIGYCRKTKTAPSPVALS